MRNTRGRGGKIASKTRKNTSFWVITSKRISRTILYCYSLMEKELSCEVEEAAKLAAEYNRQLNQERREQRNSYFDIQTFTVHKPKTG